MASVHDYYYELPEELIAQSPSEKRDGCRLLTVDRTSGELEHRIFSDITEYLNEGDALVINDSKVIPARLYGKKESLGESEGAFCEAVLLRARGGDVWEAIVRPGKRLKKGARILFEAGLTAEIADVLEDGNRLLKFDYDRKKYQNFFAVLDEAGNVPLPPYITAKPEDEGKYQTVYANEPGSAAAPTAGLHFTEELLSRLEAKGVKIVRVMLHVGLGTFRPVKEEEIEDHVMHSEFFTLTEEAASALNEVKKSGKRIIAVGTTSCRVLESAANEDGVLIPQSRDTDIFIYPPYRFKVMDALITNFHLPESTLLMLVSAFSSREIMLRAYNEAIKERYGFFSFGDAMLIR